MKREFFFHKPGIQDPLHPPFLMQILFEIKPETLCKMSTFFSYISTIFYLMNYSMIKYMETLQAEQGQQLEEIWYVVFVWVPYKNRYCLEMWANFGNLSSLWNGRLNIKLHAAVKYPLYLWIIFNTIKYNAECISTTHKTCLW